MNEFAAESAASRASLMRRIRLNPDLPIADAALLTNREAAALLGVVPKTLEKRRYRASRGGSDPVPFVRVGGRVRYRLSDVLAVLTGAEPGAGRSAVG